MGFRVFFLQQTAKVCDDNILLGLFLKHSQWPPKAFAPLVGLRADAALNLPRISEAFCICINPNPTLNINPNAWNEQLKVLKHMG